MVQASHLGKVAWPIRPGHLGGPEQGAQRGPQAPIFPPLAWYQNGASLTLARGPGQGQEVQEVQGQRFKVRGSRSPDVRGSNTRGHWSEFNIKKHQRSEIQTPDVGGKRSRFKH